MRTTKRTKAKPQAVQLCLFSEVEMAGMIEQIELKPIDLFTADPARLLWQLEIGQLLHGKAGREHRRTFTQRRQRVILERCERSIAAMLFDD